MEDKESQKPSEKPQKAPRAARKALYAGAIAALLLMLMGAWICRSILEPKPAPSPTKPATVALIDVRRALEAHPGYEELKQLRQQEIRLRSEMKDAMVPVMVEPPKVSETPFQDSVWQKNAQNVIGTAAEISRQEKKAAEEYRAATEAEYIAKRDEIDGEYLNAILNIQLKLQNQDNLRLTQEAVDELISRREALQRERGARQMELAQAWEREIVEYAEEAVRESKEQLQQEAQRSKTALELDAAKKQAEAQARDASTMEQAMQKSMERQQNRLRIFQELQETIKERIAVESHMMSDIAGLTAKLAILHHYTMVISNPAQTLRTRIPWQRDEEGKDEEEKEYMPVIGPSTADMTEELLAEIQKL